MESNGLPDKIHMSQATADLLKEAGKNHWLTARDELIKAKGKGDMQTYWATVRSSDGHQSVTTTRTRTVSSTRSSDSSDEAILSSLSKTVLREGPNSYH